MANPFHALKRFWMVRKERTKYFGLLLLTFALGATLASWPWQQTSVPEFFRAVTPRVGEALMIAPILALIVDGAAKRKLLREFAIDVSSNIIGRHLPASMREAAREHLSVSVIRSRWSVTYTIAEIPGAPGYVRLHTRSEWELENRLEKGQTCQLSFTVEKSWFPEVGETEITRLGFEDPSGFDSFDYCKGDKGLSLTLEGNMWAVAKKAINLPARPHPIFKCWAECDEVYRSDFSTPFVADSPIEFLIVTVKYPDGKFNVGLELSFEDSKLNNPWRSAGEVKWELSKPMLTGQAFFTTWSRTDRNQSTTAGV
jgi:hypothetical protein